MQTHAFSLRVSHLSRPLTFLLLIWVLESLVGQFPACYVQCWGQVGSCTNVP